MMKFFRKHNKKLLALFMVLLMIVFVGGGALDRLLQPTVDQVIAVSNVGDITFLDQKLADSTTQMLALVGLDWQRPVAGAVAPLETMDWVLLLREAEYLGLGPSVAAVRSTMQTILSNDELARRFRLKPDRILQAMAEFNAIRQTALAVSAASELSEAQVLAAARKALEKVRIQAVVLPAEALVDANARFSEQELLEQFRKYREREPSTGLQFGYYVPPAIQVQFVKIDAELIADELRSTRAKQLENKARKYYDERRDQDSAFRRTKFATSDESQQDTFVGPPEPAYLAWDLAKPIALEIVTKQEADSTVRGLADWLSKHLNEDWLAVPRATSGYKKAPAAAADLAHYDQVLADVPRTIAFPNAVSVGTTDFFSQDQADLVATLGPTAHRPEQGGRAQRFSELAFQTEAIIPNISDNKDAAVQDYTATFQTCRLPLSDAEGNLYLFRAIAARPGHVPESLDEVRERVLADLKLSKAFEKARAHAESLKECAAGTTLREAFESDGELVALRETTQGRKSGYFEPPPFARANERDAALGGTASAPGGGTVYVGGGLDTLPRDVVEQCFGLEGAGEPTALVELPNRATMLVVRWSETQRLDPQEFFATRKEFVQTISAMRMQAAIADWLDPEKVRARNGFRLAGAP